MTLPVAMLALFLGCGQDNLTGTTVTDENGFEEEDDTVPPVIVHEPVSTTQTFGVDVPITAEVTDEDGGVLFVYLYYKSEVGGSGDWHDVLLTGAEGVYSGIIRGRDMSGSGMDYYIEATDYAQNVAYAPEDGEDDPYHFRLAE